MKKLFLSVSLLSMCLLGFARNPATDDYEIRIAVLKEASEIILSVRGSFKVVDPLTFATLDEGRRLHKAKIYAGKGGITIGNNFYAYDHLRIESSKYLTFIHEGRKRVYRGALEIYKDKANRLLVVNHVDLERYVKGVLYHEVSDKWPMEAMKAQAVATRSYAMYQMVENHDQLFDVTNDIFSQVYGGKEAERFRTSMAASRTKGEALFFNQRILPAYFHANSGGYTEDVRELWKHDLPPLYGRLDPYAIGAPSYHWKKNFQSSKVQETLNTHGYAIGMIKEIRVQERNQSGRIRTLEILARDGQATTLTGKKFREIIGPNLIKSNNFEIVMKGYFFDLIGKGWGHGVGMCQWGAHTMAEQRKSYDEILSFYYPQTELVDIYEKNIF